MVSAQAAPIVSWTTNAPTIYSTLVDLENGGPLAPSTVVADQIQTEDLSFTGSVRANGCGFNVYPVFGVPGNFLNTYGPGCTPNTIDDSFSMALSGDVSSLAIDAYLFDDSRLRGLAGDTLSLFNDGVPVSTSSR